MSAKADNEAKATVTDLIVNLFGDSAVVYDKKIYINVLTSEGETSQISLALTAPKKKVEIDANGFASQQGSKSKEQIESEVKEYLNILDMKG